MQQYFCISLMQYYFTEANTEYWLFCYRKSVDWMKMMLTDICCYHIVKAYLEVNCISVELSAIPPIAGNPWCRPVTNLCNYFFCKSIFSTFLVVICLQIFGFFSAPLQLNHSTFVNVPFQFNFSAQRILKIMFSLMNRLRHNITKDGSLLQDG